MSVQPTQAQLQEAHRLSGLRLPLDEALRSRALAISLHNTALAIARGRTARAPVVIDQKRRAAGDID